MNELQLELEPVKDRFVQDWPKIIDVDEGWYQIIIDCDKELSDLDPNYQIYQIKQKFGNLRYYTKITQPFNEEVYFRTHSIVAKYESIAKCTCEVTGLPGVLMKSATGWYKTLNPQWTTTSEAFKNYKIVNTIDFEVLKDRDSKW